MVKCVAYDSMQFYYVYMTFILEDTEKSSSPQKYFVFLMYNHTHHLNPPYQTLVNHESIFIAIE